jgi:hypothetical protein
LTKKTKDELLITEQIDQLIQMVDVLVFRDRRYTEANYKNVQKTKDRITEAGQPRITVKTVQPAIPNVHPRQDTPNSVDTVDVILRNRMLSLTTSVHDTLEKQEEFSGTIIRKMVSSQLKISDARSEIRKQMRQREAERRLIMSELQLDKPTETYENRCERRDLESYKKRGK